MSIQLNIIVCLNVSREIHMRQCCLHRLYNFIRCHCHAAVSGGVATTLQPQGVTVLSGA